MKKRTDLIDGDLFRALFPYVHAYMHNVYPNGHGEDCTWHEGLEPAHAFATGLLSGIRFVKEYPVAAGALHRGLFSSAKALQQHPIWPTDIFGGMVSHLLDREYTPDEILARMNEFRTRYTPEQGTPVRPELVDGKLTWIEEPIEAETPSWGEEL